MLRRAVPLKISRARRNLKAMGGQDPRLHAGVVQRPDAEQQVGAFLQGVDVTVGLLDIQLQFRVTRA
ncbi:hypothetical protein D3C80_2054690 [compost metagenome]